jgi:2'-5' RNA ligase
MSFTQIIIMTRLFTCIWPPKELKQKIIKFQDEVKNLPIKGKFIESDNIHITITFIGQIDEKNIPDLKKKIQNIVNKNKKFNIKIKGLKLIPNENFIRVIGIKIKKNKDLTNLIKQIGKCINSKFYDSAKITLCRVKNVSDKKAIKKFIEKNKDLEIGQFEVKEICLVESLLKREGPTYKTLHRFELL